MHARVRRLRFDLCLVVVAALTCFATTSHAVPAQMNYQGFLSDNSSMPVTGTFPMTFTLYPDSTTGAALWTESYSAVQVTAGVFNVALGRVSPLSPSVLTGAKLWLLTNVNGTNILPRRPILTMGYAFRAAVADFAVSSGPDVWTVNGSDIYRLNGYVGIGTSSPTAQLDIASAAGQAVERLRSSSGALITMQRYNSGSSFFVETGANAVDNFSIHRGAPYNDFVIRGDGNVGLGTTNPGYPLEVTTTIPTTLAYFHSEATSGNNYAVDGQALGVGAAMNVGGYFAAYGAPGITVNHNNHAILVPPDRGNVGIGTASPYRYAELHVVAPVGQMAVYGVGYGGIVGLGDDGVNSSTTGVYGYSEFGYGVWGDGSNLAGYFSGNVQVTGTIFNSLSGTSIDHPLAPSEKILSHAAVQSPELKNIYDGVVTTNTSGFATVELPEYFGVLNRDFRYQLTVIGSFTQAIVSREIENNRFTIQTEKPGVKVSWQVTGIRKDRFAESHPLVVEEDKRPEDRGKYVNPEAFGRPHDQTIGYRRPPGRPGVEDH